VRLKIMINGQETEFSEGITIAELIVKKGLNPNSIVVEHNYEIIKKDSWSRIVLQQNDNLEILTFVGGG